MEFEEPLFGRLVAEATRMLTWLLCLTVLIVGMFVGIRIVTEPAEKPRKVKQPFRAMEKLVDEPQNTTGDSRVDRLSEHRSTGADSTTEGRASPRPATGTATEPRPATHRPE